MQPLTFIGYWEYWGVYAGIRPNVGPDETSSRGGLLPAQSPVQALCRTRRDLQSRRTLARAEPRSGSVQNPTRPPVEEDSCRRRDPFGLCADPTGSMLRRRKIHMSCLPWSVPSGSTSWPGTFMGFSRNGRDQGIRAAECLMSSPAVPYTVTGSYGLWCMDPFTRKGRDQGIRAAECLMSSTLDPLQPLHLLTSKNQGTLFLLQRNHAKG